MVTVVWTKCLVCFFAQCIDLLEGLIQSKEEHGVLSANHLSRLFVFALMWGVGALLELEDRAKMEEFLVNHGKLPLPDIDEGTQDTIFEFVVDDCGEYTATDGFHSLVMGFGLVSETRGREV